WGLQGAHRGGTGAPQDRACTALAQRVAKLCVAPQFIVPRHPAVRHLFTPRVEHLHTLLVARLITDFWWHVACLALLLVSGPLLGEGQAEGKQGMVMVRDVAHEDADLAVVDLAPVTTPLALDPHRMRAALGEAAGIEGDDPIGFAQPLRHLSD